jgi:hypothetical protein
MWIRELAIGWERVYKPSEHASASVTRGTRDAVPTLMLIEIGRRVLEYKNKITARMIKQNRGTMPIFGRGDLVWFLFSTKLRLSTELKKVSCRILEYSRKVSL